MNNQVCALYGVKIPENACTNTDKEVWREKSKDYYSNSIHVTQQNGIGINCGGYVIVAPPEKWHDCGKKLLGNINVPTWLWKIAMWIIDYNYKKEKKRWLK